MDHELEARIRDLRAQGGSAFEKVRLLVALERTGRSDQAWDVGLGFVAARPDRGGEVREWLAALARREPAVVVPRIRHARPALAREAVEILDVFSLERPLIALALGEDTPRPVRRLVAPLIDRRVEEFGLQCTCSPPSYFEVECLRIWLEKARRERRILILPLLRTVMDPTGNPSWTPIVPAARGAWRDLAGGPPPFDEERFLAAR